MNTTICKLCIKPIERWDDVSFDQGERYHFRCYKDLPKPETNNAEIEGSARECEGCAELEAENEKLQKRIEFIKEVRSCDTHKTERSWVGWGCPDCMRELRQRNAELENRVASFQRAQSKIIGELKRRGDDELISKVNEWVHEGDDVAKRKKA